LPSTTTCDELIAETAALDRRAGAIQGSRELSGTRSKIDELIAAYQSWYARALTMLPNELQEKFIDLYEGGVFIKRIKAFLEAPSAVNPIFDPEQGSGLISYWAHPFETTFHASLLEQRQLLTLAKQIAEEAVSSAQIELLVQIGRGFPDLVSALAHRHAGRPRFGLRTSTTCRISSEVYSG
jgi:hypothetical protein